MDRKIIDVCNKGSTEDKINAVQNFLQTLKSCYESERPMYVSFLSNLVLNDEFVKTMKGLNEVEAVVSTFINSGPKIQDVLLIPLRSIVNRSHAFCETLGRNTEFIKSLTNHLQKTDVKGSKVHISGMFATMAGYIADTNIVKNALEKYIFPIIQKGKEPQSEIANALDCLMESSAIDSARPILLRFRMKEIVQPLVDNQESQHHFIACVIQAFLASSDINQNNPFGSNPTSPKVISRILGVIDIFITSKSNFYLYNEYGSVSYIISCSNVLKAIGSLATNEGNMKELKSNGIVQRIIDLTTKRKTDLLETNFRTAEELAKVIWILSFDRECKNEFVEKGIIDMLKELNVKESLGAQRAIQGALFTLIGAFQTQNQSQNKKEGEGKEPKKGYVMISYCWAQKEKAREIGNYLKSKGISIWIDVEQMEGSVLEKMAEAVEDASVILIFLSSHYKESQACRTEAEYAYTLKKEVVCIMAEDDYKPRGWLGALLGNKLWYNLWKNQIFQEESFLPIISQLAKSLDQPPITIQIKEQVQEKEKVKEKMKEKETETFNSSKSIQISTNNENQNQNENQNHQEILNILDKIVKKMDGLESRLEKMEVQSQKDKMKLEATIEKLDQVLAKLETHPEKLEKKKSFFSKSSS